MSKELTEKWAIITPENCQEINAMISGYKKKIAHLKEQLNEANEVIKGYSKLEGLMNCALGPTENCPSQKYIEKWGVK